MKVFIWLLGAGMAGVISTVCGLNFTEEPLRYLAWNVPFCVIWTFLFWI